MSLEVMIAAENAESDEAARLFRALDDDLRVRYPGDEPTHFEPKEALAFFVARTGDVAESVGCVALRGYAPQAGEIKRMFVADAWRGRGIGRALLVAVEDAARDAGFVRVVLETGWEQPEAMALYERNGYTRIPAYGQFADHPSSVCYEKSLR